MVDDADVVFPEEVGEGGAVVADEGFFDFEGFFCAETFLQMFEEGPEFVVEVVVGEFVNEGVEPEAAFDAGVEFDESAGVVQADCAVAAKFTLADLGLLYFWRCGVAHLLPPKNWRRKSGIAEDGWGVCAASASRVSCSPFSRAVLNVTSKNLRIPAGEKTIFSARSAGFFCT
ncbi:MAG: hypothetical protein EBR82_19185 [Caulobacteraceae bacterium]|nr:hypothetical protein [Caulobacteraceae bacterium]